MANSSSPLRWLSRAGALLQRACWSRNDQRNASRCHTSANRSYPHAYAATIHMPCGYRALPEFAFCGSAPARESQQGEEDGCSPPQARCPGCEWRTHHLRFVGFRAQARSYRERAGRGMTSATQVVATQVRIAVIHMLMQRLSTWPVDIAHCRSLLSVGARLRAKANRARKTDPHLRKPGVLAANGELIISAPLVFARRCAPTESVLVAE
ncbi:hypothetical protein EC912_104377 [Luteibacter rhizovicinus]|uniref:Uncharacterized protein n=1 Tax=Luteibacter rhizovicinus TaxID=242606 RepID=A0A4V6P445_9GAMM|nr:hypothetical protein EC912_104377 [Luteibacter rhizovicinus]